ncbi:MAG: TetR/AcrR family transcriptional regulator [Myxococcaceae bacterium]
MGRPTQEQARDTRRDILDAALDLFAKDGFHGTSVREIARAVGVRESALYHHFPSKDAILEALTQELGPGRFEQVAGPDVGGLLDAVGPRKVLHELAHGLFLLWTTPGEQKFLRIMMTEGLRAGGSGGIHPSAVLGQAVDKVTGLFTEMMRRKLIRKADPVVFARAFMGPMMMMRMMYLVLPGGPPKKWQLEALVDSHVDFLWEAVRR